MCLYFLLKVLLAFIVVVNEGGGGEPGQRAEAVQAPEHSGRPTKTKIVI